MTRITAKLIDKEPKRIRVEKDYFLKRKEQAKFPGRLAKNLLWIILVILE